MTHFDDLLKKAFLVGFDTGRNYPGTVPAADFNEWRASLSGLNIIDDHPAPLTVDTIVVGMFYRVETDDPLFAPINDRVVIVVRKGEQFVDVRLPNSHDFWSIRPDKLVRV